MDGSSGHASPDVFDAALDVASFARAFSQRAPNLAWFLGAGASAQSFVPTAGQLVDALLKQLYCSERGVPVDSIDLSDHHVRRRLQEPYSGQRGLPAYDDPRFYSEIFDRAFPNARDRAAFIEQQVRTATPNYGHQVLAGLVAAGTTKLMVTSNFDPLVERAINPALDGDLFDGRQLEVVDLDNSSRAAMALSADRWPLLVKIHGDYRSEHLKNITAELQEQDAELRRVVASALGRFGLIVVGYSGRDESVMNMLRDVLALPTPYPAGLHWVHRPQDQLSNEVEALLADVRSSGVEATTVAASSFVELATRLEHGVKHPEPIRRWLAARAPQSVRRAEPGPSGPTATAPQLKLNALKVLRLPTEARKLNCPTPVPLAQLREALRRPELEALVGLSAGSPVAIGRDAHLRSALADLRVEVTQARTPLALGTSEDDGVDHQALGLVTDCLVIGMTRGRPLAPVLRSNRDHLLRVQRPNDSSLRELRRACGGELRGEIRQRRSGLRLPWAEAIAVHLEQLRGQWWLVLNPEIWTRRTPIVDDGFPEPPPDAIDALYEELRGFVRERHARRYNRQTGELLAAWIGVLTGGSQVEVRAFGLTESEGVDATIVLDGVAADSLPLLTGRGGHGGN